MEASASFGLIIHGRREAMQRRPMNKKERSQHCLRISLQIRAFEKEFKTLCASKIVPQDMGSLGISVGESSGMVSKTLEVPKITRCIDYLELLHE